MEEKTKAFDRGTPTTEKEKEEGTVENKDTANAKREGAREDREQALLERERALAARERRFAARERLIKRGLPEEAAELVDVRDDAACEKTLAAIEKLYARFGAFSGAPTVAETESANSSYEERVRRYLSKYGRFEE